MKKSSIKVGQRVKIFNAFGRSYLSRGWYKGTIQNISETDECIVAMDPGYNVSEITAHYSHLILLKPKKKAPVITREMLAKAWDEVIVPAGDLYGIAETSHAFFRFCKHLGIE